ncbi:MAG: gephyrin-like molybdotransferase Glp [Gemmatimonadaceae bacterium]|nr:gephyrin-like molybdotransferase Glp [Gemmatimonadaceae bacterium]
MSTPPRIPVDEAVARILAAVVVLPSEELAVRDALGRVLAEEIIAPYTHPMWRNSAMDGYAAHSSDIAGASSERPVTLTVRGTIAAGGSAPAQVPRGSAWRIMTGAPVPDGVDTVIRVEDTNAGEAQVQIRSDRDVQRNVRPRGEDFAAGDVLIARETWLRPAHIGLAAACGRSALSVVRAPRVAILTSGNELVDVDAFDAVLAGRRIVNTNGYALAAAVRDAGGEPIELGIATDDPVAIAAHIAAAPPFDALITSGGISVGAFDYTRDVIQRLGATLDFWRVRMRPGGPFGFGLLEGRPWFGLPGNPVSAMVTFELFVRPALLRMRGHHHVEREPVKVRLMEPVRTQGGLTHFLRAVVNENHDVVLTGPQGSGMLTSMAHANALLIVPHDETSLAEGSTAFALLLHDNSQLVAKWTF